MGHAPGASLVARPHDTIAKVLVQNHDLAREVFQLGLPKELVECIDWSTLGDSSKQFTNTAMGRRFGDGVFTASCQGQPMLLMPVDVGGPQ